MTARDELRAKCIEAIAREQCRQEHAGMLSPGYWREEEIVQRTEIYWPNWIGVATLILDSLHDVANVCPVEATEEMVNAALNGGTFEGSVRSDYRAMCAAGRLTNPPGEKS